MNNGHVVCHIFFVSADFSMFIPLGPADVRDKASRQSEH